MKQFVSTAVMVFLSLPVLSSAAAPVKKSAKQALLLELTGKDTSRISPVDLYAEIASAYQADDELALKSRMQNMLSRYPQSEFADNALYLAGRMAMDHRNYAEAIKLFTRIRTQYPHGDKAAAAEFAKGMAYKKMNLPKYAQQVLTDVKKRYPGSPESFRAASEIKILK